MSSRGKGPKAELINCVVFPQSPYTWVIVFIDKNLGRTLGGAVQASATGVDQGLCALRLKGFDVGQAIHRKAILVSDGLGLVRGVIDFVFDVDTQVTKICADILGFLCVHCMHQYGWKREGALAGAPV